MEQDKQQLKLLSIFHFVLGGLAALIACIPIIHLTIGIGILSGSLFGESIPTDGAFPFSLFGLAFTILPAIMILAGWAYAVGMVVAGNFLAKEKNYVFCLVMAAISCAFTPFGTVLGVFTIVVLMRPSVKQLFNYPAPAGQ
jgi:hypothetical protein